MIPEPFGRMNEFEASPAEISEAAEVSTEVGCLLEKARGASGIFQVRIHLHRFIKLGRHYSHETCFHGCKVGFEVIESDPTGANGVLVTISINPCQCMIKQY